MSDKPGDYTPQEQTGPRVSVGLPVFNGENYLAEAIDSILAQTFTDFELIISDNASTDRTEEISRVYVERDNRVRYFRHATNRGASPNYNFTVGQARGTYFKWMAHDDVLRPRFLEEAVRVLDDRPDVSLVYSKTRKIDENGVVTGDYDFLEDELRIDAAKPHTRFGDYICRAHNCLGIFGLMRLEQLLQTNLHAAYQGADRVLIAEMALIGRVYRVPQYLFDRRDHPGAYTAQPSGGSRLGWWDTQQAERLHFPHWRKLLEYNRALSRVELPVTERLACYMEFGRWLVSPKWYRPGLLRLIGDLLKSVATLLLSRSRRVSHEG